MKNELKKIMLFVRAILYPKSSIAIICDNKESEKEYFDDMKNLIEKHNALHSGIADADNTQINFTNGSRVIITNPKEPQEVIRSKRADISHWIYDYEAFSISKEEFDKVVEPFINRQ